MNNKMYAQEYEIKENKHCDKVRLKVKGKWLDGELQDLSHNTIELPHNVYIGERYYIVAKK